MAGSASDTGSAVVIARDAMRAARIEAALRALAGWRVVVGTPRGLRALVDERPDAVVVTALGDVETRRLLHDLDASPLRPAIVALADDPARLWTPALRARGLRAALPHHATGAELASAVSAVRAGLFVLHPEALARPAPGAPQAGPAPLTAREREILEMMADGARNAAIAARLGISRHTVKFHVASILTKLGARTRTEAVTLALRGGHLVV